MSANELKYIRFERPDYDAVWKELLKTFFYPMLESVMPKLAQAADRTRDVKFLDKEFNSIRRELSDGDLNIKRQVDMLAEIPLKADASDASKSAMVLLHCEVQGRGNSEDLRERMCRYQYMIALRHRMPLTALALITEPLPPEQMSGVYHAETFYSEQLYRFKVVKVFEASEELIASGNLFDLAQLAAARAWRAKKDEVKRLEYLKELLKILKGKGLSHQEMHSLMKFLEMISRIRKPELAEDYMKFSEGLDEKGEEPMLMREQVAMHKGKIEGRQEGISIGEMRGKKQGKLIAAHKLLARGVPIKLLAEGIGLSEKDIALLNRQSRKKVIKK